MFPLIDMQFTGWIDITGLVQVADMECFKRIIMKIASTLLQNKSKSQLENIIHHLSKP